MSTDPKSFDRIFNRAAARSRRPAAGFSVSITAALGVFASLVVPVALTALAALPAIAWATPATAPAAEVGRVSLLIGDAWVVRADGAQVPLHRGSAIHVGDRIETSANGHVHMRFVDNAAISVRPESVLQVQAYQFDVQKPKDNEIRLRVEKGAARSISGAATDLDKSRFRLNTPIAAIGVRGTDFIVYTDPAGMRATVADGTIVVAALGGNCAASGLGPCAGAEVRELSADMGRLMAEVRPGEYATRISPAVDVTAVAGKAPSEALVGFSAASLAAMRAAGLSAAEPTAAEISRGNDRAAADLLTLAAVNIPDLNRLPDSAAQMRWGYDSFATTPDDNVTEFFTLVQSGRHVTTCDSLRCLWRSNQTVPGELFPSTLGGTVEFRLNRASLAFESGTQTESAVIGRANLTIDFSRRTFASALDMASASGVKGELRMAGTMRADGIFTLRDTDQYISGAVSLDGKEAGYLFTRDAAGGLFRGRTLWGGP